MATLKKVTITVLLMASAVLAGKFLGNYAAKSRIDNTNASSVQHKESISLAGSTLSLQQVADTMNKRLPIDSGQGMTMDRVAAGPGRMLTINYGIHLLPSNEIDQAMRDSVRTDLVASRCNPGPIRDLLRSNVDIVVVYAASDGKEVLRVLNPGGSCAP